jgi:hypothetical protein
VQKFDVGGRFLLPRILTAKGFCAMSSVPPGQAHSCRRLDSANSATTTLEVTKADGEALVSFSPALDEMHFSELLPVVEMSNTKTELRDDLAWLAKRWHRKLGFKPR